MAAFARVVSRRFRWARVSSSVPVINAGTTTSFVCPIGDIPLIPAKHSRKISVVHLHHTLRDFRKCTARQKVSHSCICRATRWRCKYISRSRSKSDLPLAILSSGTSIQPDITPTSVAALTFRYNWEHVNARTLHSPLEVVDSIQIVVVELPFWVFGPTCSAGFDWFSLDNLTILWRMRNHISGINLKHPVNCFLDFALVNVYCKLCGASPVIICNIRITVDLLVSHLSRITSIKISQLHAVSRVPYETIH
mmetsp:Transcript_3053/g.6451  ORF Transcript_3053/g.6451 Transcript_3053/m.6451 type:complete len:251 (-) Transcript_3053:527-1279(-)